MICANCHQEFEPSRQQRWHAAKGHEAFCGLKCRAAHHPRLRTITYAGTTRSVREWEQYMHYPARTIARRLSHGWDPILAIVVRPKHKVTP